MLFVDVDPEQEATLQSVVSEHPKLVSAGEGSATPKLVVRGQDTFNRIMKTAP